MTEPVLPAQAAPARRGYGRALSALCITELMSWSALCYSLPVALIEVARDTGWSPTSIMGAFSAGQIISAVAAPPVGRLLERHFPALR